MMSKLKLKSNLGFLKGETLRGWAMFENALDIQPEIIIKIDDNELCRIKADIFREDILKKKIHPTGNCGFEVINFNRDVSREGIYVRAIAAQTGEELTNSPVLLRGRMSDIAVGEYNPFVFVHIPKTAGTSFRIAANDFFGEKKIAQDYGKDSPDTSNIFLNTFYSKRKEALVPELFANNIRFVTGHYEIKDYVDIFNCRVRWCTFLRDPVQRIISEYKHLKRLYSYKKPFSFFIKQEHQRNKQAKALKGLNPEDLFFVGITEEYENSIRLFNRVTGLELPTLQLNVGGKKLGSIYSATEKEKELIISLNLDDIEIYENVKKIMINRIKS